MDTMKDKDFLADAEKAQMEITPVAGEQVAGAGEGDLRSAARDRAQGRGDAAIAALQHFKTNRNLMDAKVKNYTGWQSDVIVD